MTNSIWSETVELPQFDKLTENLQTDVLIIGGGMAGILCAYMLHQNKVKYALVEGRTIGSGNTQNTTAKITSQHGLIYHKLIEQKGVEKARMYLHANEEALGKYRELCKGLDCDFEEKDAFVYSLNDKEKLNREAEALSKLNFAVTLEDTWPLPFPIAGAIRFPNQAQFNPLKFVKAISKELHIYEHTFVKKISGHKAMTTHGTITATKIIVTSHFPFMDRHGSYFLKMYQERSYVLALENAPLEAGMYIDEAENGISLRNYKDLLLVGGGGHRTGKQGGNWGELRQFVETYYPTATETDRWAAQDCMTLDSIPYIGNYSKLTPDLYTATGFNKWGMTSSMVSAMILSNMVMGKEHPYAAVFSPSRNILTRQLARNAFEATRNLMTISSPRCPHLGCALKWNFAEHSWDCPCHGSRFDDKGNLTDNPATRNLKKSLKNSSSL